MIDIISFEELYDGVEQDASDSKIKIAAQALLTAINDWPILNLSEPKELLLALTNEIGAPLTPKRIEHYSKTLIVNNNGWKMEAISSLLGKPSSNPCFPLQIFSNFAVVVLQC